MLLFPAVQRHRYFRLKARLPGAASHAARMAALAFVGAAATAALRAHAVGGVLGSLSPGAGGAWPLTLGGSAAALLAGGLCAFCWLMGAAALEVVFSERLRPDDYSDRCGCCHAGCTRRAQLRRGGMGMNGMACTWCCSMWHAPWAWQCHGHGRPWLSCHATCGFKPRQKQVRVSRFAGTC